MSAPSLPLAASLLALALTIMALAAWALIPRAAMCKAEVAGVVTLPELKARHADFNGCVVRVRGFLDPFCAKNACTLAEKRQSVGLRGTDVEMSIGPDDAFDRRAQAFLDREVMLEARFDDQCLKPDIICLDRWPTLQPVPATPITLLESK